MKFLFLVGILLSLSLSAHAEERAESIDWPLQKAFIPIGFDDNDNAQVVVAGVFPNSCYQVGQMLVKQDGPEDGEISLRLTAYTRGSRCLQVENPFHQTIDLGRLHKGAYSIMDATSGKELGTLHIAEAKVSLGPDDYPYAPVYDATVFRTKQGVKRLMLIGVYTDKCMRISGEPTIHYYPDVIVVQPVIAMKPGDECGSDRIPFIKFYNLKADSPENFLLHVRSMNGAAVNRVLDLARPSITGA